MGSKMRVGPTVARIRPLSAGHCSGAAWLTHLACFRTPRRPRALRFAPVSQRNARPHRIQGRPVNGRLFPGATLIISPNRFSSHVFHPRKFCEKTVRAFHRCASARTPAQTFVSGPLSEQSDVARKTPMDGTVPLARMHHPSPDSVSIGEMWRLRAGKKPHR